ncbi:unnamed protein product [Urochloa humidicola]
MRCYTSHKRMIRFMQIMCDVPRAICIYPSALLSEVCREISFSEPVYLEISQERSMFEFNVKFRRDGCSSSVEVNEVECTGFPFREKADAIESAALSALENMLYCHGIICGQYNDIDFCEYWPLFKHLSENVKGTKCSVLRLLDKIRALCKFLDDARLSFQSRNSDLRTASGSSDDTAMLDECESQLRMIHDTLLAESQEYRDNFRWHFQPNRPDKHDYYEGSYVVKKEMDIIFKCKTIIKLTLDKLCEAACYSIGAISHRCICEGSYVAELVVINPADPDDHNHIRLSSGECPSISEAEHAVIYRAIWFVCRREGYKIIDPGYNDFRDMQRDSFCLRYRLPNLCETLVKLKAIVQRGFCRLDIVGQKYYRATKKQVAQ